MLLSEVFLRACVDDAFFEFRDVDGLDEVFDELSVIFELDGHEVKHETFEEMAEALN